jgi:hypothetical protein
MDRDTGRKADSDERNHRNQDRRKGFAVMEVTGFSEAQSWSDRHLSANIGRSLHRVDRPEPGISAPR